MKKDYLVTKNVIYNFLGQFGLFFISFITTPIVVHSLGNANYGIFTLVSVVIGYLSLLDLGLGLSIVKYLSDYYAENSYSKMEKVINTSLVTYLTIGIVGGLILFGLADYLVLILQIPPELKEMAVLVFQLSAFGFFINMVFTVFNSIPNALQRMDLTNSRSLVFGVINAVGTVLLVSLGFGLLSIVIWNIVSTIIVTIFYIHLILKLLPEVSIKFDFDRKIFLKIMKFSGFKLVSNICGQVVFQLDKLIIGFFYPISWVTFFAIPAALVQKGFSVMLNITSAVFPALSELKTLNDIERAKDLYIRSTKFIVLVMFPIMTVLFLFAPQILELWLGGDFAEKSSLVLRLLAIAYFIASLSAPGVTVSDAFGKPQIPAFFSLISAAINLVAILLLVPKFGIVGAAIALLINFVAQIPIFMIVVHKRVIFVRNRDVLLEAIIKPIISGIFAGAVAYFVSLQLSIMLLSLIAGLVSFAVLYLLSNLMLGTFDERDKKAMYFFYQKISGIKTKHI